MFWMIGGDDREYGPVPARQLREWIREGRANAQTRVRSDPAGPWQPLANFAEFVPDLAAVEAEWTAANRPPVSVEPRMPAESQSEYRPAAELDIAACLGRAWELLTRHLLTIGGVCAVVWGILLVTSMLTCVGPLVSLALSGPLYAGLCLVLLRVVRGQPSLVGEVFTFFGPRFPQLMLLGLAVEVLTVLGLLLCVVPGLVLKVVWIFAYVLAAERPGNFWEILEESRRTVITRFVPLGLLLLLAWLPVVLVSIHVWLRSAGLFSELFMSSGSFVYDREQFLEFARFTSRLELQRAVVILLNMPFALTATVLAYETIFRPRADAPDATA